MVCQADRSWFGNPPLCLPKSCGEPLSIENATVRTENGLDFDAQATYECDVGFNPSGEHNIR